MEWITLSQLSLLKWIWHPTEKRSLLRQHISLTSYQYVWTWLWCLLVFMPVVLAWKPQLIQLNILHTHMSIALTDSKDRKIVLFGIFEYLWMPLTIRQGSKRMRKGGMKGEDRMRGSEWVRTCQHSFRHLSQSRHDQKNAYLIMQIHSLTG